MKTVAQVESLSSSFREQDVLALFESARLNKLAKYNKESPLSMNVDWPWKFMRALHDDLIKFRAISIRTLTSATQLSNNDKWCTLNTLNLIVF